MFFFLRDIVPGPANPNPKAQLVICAILTVVLGAAKLLEAPMLLVIALPLMIASYVV